MKKLFGFGPIPEELKHLPKISPSGLVKFLESPAHYKAYIDKEFETTKAMEEGTLIHMACLESDKFLSEYCCEPLKEDFPNALITVEDIKARLTDLNFAFKKSAKKAELIADLKSIDPSAQIMDEIIESVSQGKIVLNKKIWNACIRLAEKMNKRNFESKFLPKATKEQYIWWLHPLGVIISMRPDAYGMEIGEKSLNVCADIKKVTSVDDRAIGYEMIDNYHPMKAAIYNEGLSYVFGKEFDYFCFIFVTASAPYSIKNVTLTKGHLDAGSEQFYRALEAWIECYKNNYWPDEAEDVINWNEPQYFFGSVESEASRLERFTERVKNKFKQNYKE